MVFRELESPRFQNFLYRMENVFHTKMEVKIGVILILVFAFRLE